MKKHMKWILLIGTASVAVMALAQGVPGQKIAPAPVDLQALQTQVAQLRSRVQALEARQQKLEAQVDSMSRPRLTPLITPPAANQPLIQPPAADSTPPTVWGQKKVNGWTVYIVPCQQQDH